MSNKDKKLIILDHGGGRLANQLWNLIAIYAYAVEKEYKIENWEAFEYINYFQIPEVKNKFVKFLFFNRFITKIENSFLKKWFRRRLVRKIIYKSFSKILKFFNKNRVIDAKKDNPVLPPTNNSSKIKGLESKLGNIYFYNWRFKNPKGIKKHRNKITNYLNPKEKYKKEPQRIINLARKNFEKVIGVHIRQGDYKLDSVRHDFFSSSEVKEILKNYLNFINKNPSEVSFIVCSDGPIDKKEFGNLNIIKGPGGELEDLITLSMTDTIIGSDSTYGFFASYWGNIPFIVFEKNGVEWDYYRDKDSFFENKKYQFYK